MNIRQAQAMERFSEVSQEIEEALKQPKREWVGLTNEEIKTFKQSCHLGNSGYNTCIKRFAIAIEAKLKEKNT